MKTSLVIFSIITFFAATLSANQIKFSHLTIKNGLSQSSVKCIFQDSRGFMWFGTADGLNKYDGSQFHKYYNNPVRLNSLNGNDIKCIYENAENGNLWIGTQSHGLNLYNRDQDSFFSFSSQNKKQGELPSNFINDINSTGKTLWVATRTGGLCFFNISDSTFHQTAFSTSDSFKNIKSIEKDKDGNLWLGTPQGLYRWRYANKLNSEIPKKINIAEKERNNIDALCFDRKGYLWIGTRNNGLFRFHPKLNETMHFEANATPNSIPHKRIYNIVERKNGEIWIATASGLCKYQQNTNDFIIHKNDATDEESLNNNRIYSLYEDESGILWVGTYLGGINKLDPMENRFKKYNFFKNIEGASNISTDIRSLCIENNRKLWIGTSDGLIEAENYENGISKDNSEMHLSKLSIGSLLSTQNGIIVSTNMGIFLRRSNKFENLSDKIRRTLQKKILTYSSGIIDESNQIWLSTSNGLLKCSPNLSHFQYFTPLKEANSNIDFYPLCIQEDVNGIIWIGTLSGQVFSFDKYSKQFELVIQSDPKDEIKNFSKVFSISTATPGEIWLGTNLGLYKYNTTNRILERYLKNDGLSNDVVYAAISDKTGNIWCSTNLGVSRLNPNTKTFQNFTYQDGLQSNEFNQGAYYIDQEGLIYLGGIEGLNIFNPVTIELNSYIPKVIITNMEVQHVKVTPQSHPDITTKHISETKVIHLNHKQNAFSFEFTALSFSTPDRNKYQYSLTKHGEQDNWIDAGSTRMATYTNIEPGEYLFKVKGANADGLYNSTPTYLKLIITPPFWKTWWFRIILISFVIIVTYTAISYRIRRLNKQKQVLKKLVKQKTKAIVTQKKEIENQNNQLKATNERILRKNQKIEHNNELLHNQHKQLIEQRDVLLDLAEKIESENQNKFRFFTSVSHELRTPLTLIINPLNEIITNKKQQGESVRKLRNIHQNASKLLVTVNQLLDFRKAETGNLQLKISNFDLSPFVQKCCLMFNDFAIQKKIHLEFNTNSINLNVWADKYLIEKTLFNLISYAFSVTRPNNAISVTVNTKDQLFAVITVKDNGIGIKQEDIDSLFERFNHVSETYNSQERRSGLEIALVKRYTEQHKGFVEVESVKGRGNEFRVFLPLGKDHFDDNVLLADSENQNKTLFQSSIGTFTPSVQQRNNEGSKAGKSTLLLIEANDDIRNYISEILSEHFIITAAKSAKEGYQKAKKKIPELIISEVLLDESSGYQLVEKIRSDFKTSHLPVILLSTLAGKEDEMKGLSAGADAYIAKPFDMQHLLLVAKNLITTRRILQKKYNLGESDNIENLVANPNDQRFITEAIQHVHRHIADSSFNVAELCSHLNLSQPQCYRRIKAITGLNISEFIRNTRLKEATKLLKESNLKISEVAYHTGFNDPNYFTKSFIRLYDISPKEFSKII